MDIPQLGQQYLMYLLQMAEQNKDIGIINYNSNNITWKSRRITFNNASDTDGYMMGTHQTMMPLLLNKIITQ